MAMFRYKVIFKHGKKRPQVTIEARNFDDALSIAEKEVRRIRRKFGDKVEVHSVERLYGEQKKPKKEGRDWSGHISNAFDVFLAGLE